MGMWEEIDEQEGHGGPREQRDWKKEMGVKKNVRYRALGEGRTE